MRAAELATLYVAVGVALGGAWCFTGAGRRWVDALLLLPLWPIYAPLLWGARWRPSVDVFDGSDDLAPRLTEASERLRRLDALLREPAFSEANATARIEALTGGRHERALAAARARLASIRRLVALRTRLADEVAAIEELQKALSVQSALLTVAGDAQGELKGLTDDLTARTEALDSLLDDHMLSDGDGLSFAARPAPAAGPPRDAA